MPDTEALLLSGLTIVTAAAVCVLCQPFVLLLCGVTECQTGSCGRSGNIDAGALLDVSPELIQGLQDRGFRSLGVIWSRNGMSVSYMYYVFGLQGEPVVAALRARSRVLLILTATRQAEMIVSSSSGRGSKVWIAQLPGSIEPDDDLPLEESCGGHPLDEVLHAHRKHVQRIRESGGEPLPTESLDECVNLIHLFHSRPQWLHWLPRRALAKLATALSLALVTGISLAFLDKHDHGARMFLVGVLLGSLAQILHRGRWPASMNIERECRRLDSPDSPTGD